MCAASFKLSFTCACFIKCLELYSVSIRPIFNHIFSQLYVTATLCLPRRPVLYKGHDTRRTLIGRPTSHQPPLRIQRTLFSRSAAPSAEANDITANVNMQMCVHNDVRLSVLSCLNFKQCQLFHACVNCTTKHCIVTTCNITAHRILCSAGGCR